MSSDSNKLFHFWQELKRRNVIRVITVYAASAFVILELVDMITEPFGLPVWTFKLVVVILAVGLIVAVILSWIYDINPEGGIVKTEPVYKAKTEDIHKSSNSWKIASYISFVVIVGLIILHVFSGPGKHKIKDKSIAVLPFKSLSDDPEKQYLADGVMESILFNLSEIDDLRVQARTSVQQYRNTNKTATDICYELNVSYILEGSFQKYGNKARLIVQLIQPGIEGQVWSGEYDREWKDIFAVQSEVARSVASELQAVITKDEIKMLDKIPTSNLRAYELYLTGRGFWNRWSDEDIIRGMEYFQKAIDLDPGFALAYAGLANAYNTVSFYSQIDPGKTYPKAREMALKALELDPDLAEAYIALAFVKTYYDWDWNGGEKAFKQAIELEPENITAHHLYAYFLLLETRYDEAMREIRTALSLDPNNLITNRTLGDFYYNMGEYDEAEKQLNKTLAMDSAFNYAHAYLGLTYLQKSMCNKGLEELQKELDYGHGTTDVALAWKGYACGICGDVKQGREILELFLNRSESEYIPPSFLTWICFALGEDELGFEWLEKASSDRDPWLVEANISHFYDGIRTDRRFKDLLKRMGINDM